jgi:uncharacterized protein (TIGR00251 family)
VTGALGLRARNIRLQVRLTPRGGRDAIDGWSEDSAGRRLLKARVAAPPEDGKANRALVALLADALDVRKSDIAIVSGETSRLKVIEISGDPDALSARAKGLGAGD